MVVFNGNVKLNVNDNTGCVMWKLNAGRRGAFDSV